LNIKGIIGLGVWSALLAGLGAAEVENKTGHPEVVKLCVAYLRDTIPAKEMQTWLYKTGCRLNDKANDLEISVQSAADRLLNEFLQSIKADLDENHPEKMTDKTRILFCQWVYLYAIHDLTFDPEIEAKLTVVNFRKWIRTGDK
jgi:hypothetical protein